MHALSTNRVREKKQLPALPPRCNATEPGRAIDDRGTHDCLGYWTGRAIAPCPSAGHAQYDVLRVVCDIFHGITQTRSMTPTDDPPRRHVGRSTCPNCPMRSPRGHTSTRSWSSTPTSPECPRCSPRCPCPYCPSDRIEEMSDEQLSLLIMQGNPLTALPASMGSLLPEL